MLRLFLFRGKIAERKKETGYAETLGIQMDNNQNYCNRFFDGNTNRFFFAVASGGIKAGRGDILSGCPVCGYDINLCNRTQPGDDSSPMELFRTGSYFAFDAAWRTWRRNLYDNPSACFGKENQTIRPAFNSGCI